MEIFRFTLRKPETGNFTVSIYTGIIPEFRFTQQISGSFHFQNGNFFPEKWKPYLQCVPCTSTLTICTYTSSLHMHYIRHYYLHPVHKCVVCYTCYCVPWNRDRHCFLNEWNFLRTNQICFVIRLSFRKETKWIVQRNERKTIF